jgi:hypothetical protein
MEIRLDDSDFNKMPATLSSQLWRWLQDEGLQFVKGQNLNAPPKAEQLSLRLVETPLQQERDRKIKRLSTQQSRKLSEHSHVRLSQLWDSGFTGIGMDVRVRLKAEVAKKVGYSYVTKGIKISETGTVLYDGKEYDKPSPLAEKINGGSVNGWEYVEVKKNGQWICLDQLRQMWRKVS